MKLLVDMNLSPGWVKLLRDAGWEAGHWSHIGRPDAPDSEVMAYAAAHGFVVLTQISTLARFWPLRAEKSRVLCKSETRM
jgi:predicted nuclease of predicted toxin-antitoxin system